MPTIEPTKSKRILIVTHYYPPHTGGIEYVAQNQAKQLAALGDIVTVVTSRVSADEVSHTENGVRLVRVRAFNGFEKWGIPFPIFSPRLITVLFRTVKAAQVVHIHDAFYLSSWCAAIIARIYRRPIVLTQHIDLVPHASRLVKIIQQLVYGTVGAVIFRHSATIIVLNERVKRFLVDQGVDGSKIILAFNGVDSQLFRPAAPEEKKIIRDKYQLSKTKKIILFVGRVVHKKGFDKVLAAASEQYQLVFVGGDFGPNRSLNVRCLGKLPQSQLAEIYQAADIFVLPAHSEGFPLTIQEAMASGLPVIMADDDGYAAYELDQNLVYLLQQRPSSEQVREAIQSLLNDDARCQSMASQSLQYARQHFVWQRVADQLDQIYAGLLHAQHEVV